MLYLACHSKSKFCCVLAYEAYVCSLAVVIHSQLRFTWVQKTAGRVFWGLAIQESLFYVWARLATSSGDRGKTVNELPHSFLFCHQCAYLQAQNCQMESKYLTVLRKLQETLCGLPSSHADLVRNLIQEALQWDVKEGADLNLNPVR